MERMDMECNQRQTNSGITMTKGSTEGLTGLHGIVQLTFSSFCAGYLHTLPRSRLEDILHEGLLEGGEAEPDGNQRGGPGAAPGPPHRPAAPRAPSPRPHPHAAGGARRQPAQPVATDLKSRSQAIRYVFFTPPK